jgi:hypothetical protein
MNFQVRVAKDFLGDEGASSSKNEGALNKHVVQTYKATLELN